MILHWLCSLISLWIHCFWTRLFRSENYFFVVLKNIIDSLVNLRLCLTISWHLKWLYKVLFFSPYLSWLRRKNAIIDTFKLLIAWSAQFVLISKVLGKWCTNYAIRNLLVFFDSNLRTVLVGTEVILQCHCYDQITHLRYCCRSTQCVIIIIDWLAIVRIIIFQKTIDTVFGNYHLIFISVCILAFLIRLPFARSLLIISISLLGIIIMSEIDLIRFIRYLLVLLVYP